MKSIILFISFSFICLVCKKEEKNSELQLTKIENYKPATNEIPTLNYNQLKPWLNRKNDKTYIVNFWATWCIPCIKELPYFERVNSEYDNVEVILVSLDFPKHKETKLIPFVKKENIKSKVLHLNDPDEQFWIADVSEKWTGSIPATIIYNKQKREFYEKTFTQEELENEIQSFIN